jgi:hypothetical protein
VECATLEWIDWFDNGFFIEPIRHIPPAEAKASYCAQTNEHAGMA